MGWMMMMMWWVGGREGGGVLFERAGSVGTLALPLAHNYIIVD